MEKKGKDLMGVTFNGDVTFQGPMFDIHDNEHVHIGNPSQQATDKVASEQDHAGSDEPCRKDERLTMFVHPSVDSAHEWLIHDEIKRLVKRQGLQEICQYLLQMKRDAKVLLPQSPSAAYAELVRMGMPKGEGFNESTFRKYYRN